MNGKVSPCLKAYVINLAKSKDRWKYVSDQFSDSATWIEIQRLPAVYGPNLTKRQMDALIDPFVIDLLQKPEEIKMNPEVPPPGAIGCYLSHVKAWKAVLGATFERDAIAKEASRIGSVDFRSLPETTLNDRTSGHGNSINKQLLNRVLSIQDDADTDRDNHLKMANDSKQQQQQHDTQQLLHRNTTQNMALIMEDDIKILCKRKELASKLYECLKYAPSDWEMLIVEKVVHLLPPIQIKDNKRFEIPRYHICAAGYILNESGAKKLLDGCIPIRYQVDNYIAKCSGLKKYCLKNAIMTQNHDFEPTMPHNLVLRMDGTSFYLYGTKDPYFDESSKRVSNAIFSDQVYDDNSYESSHEMIGQETNNTEDPYSQHMWIGIMVGAIAFILFAVALVTGVILALRK